MWEKISWLTLPWSMDTPFTFWEMLAARLDMENFSSGFRGLSLPRDISVSQSTFRRSG